MENEETMAPTPSDLATRARILGACPADRVSLRTWLIGQALAGVALFPDLVQFGSSTPPPPGSSASAIAAAMAIQIADSILIKLAIEDYLRRTQAWTDRRES